MMKRGDYGQIVKMALDTIRSNKLRSALTVLGIVIGITTVIAVSSLINGLNENVLGGIRDLGSDTIIAYRFPWASLQRRCPEIRCHPAEVSKSGKGWEWMLRKCCS